MLVCECVYIVCVLCVWVGVSMGVSVGGMCVGGMCVGGVCVRVD